MSALGRIGIILLTTLLIGMVKPASALSYSWIKTTAPYASVTGTELSFSATYGGNASLTLPFAFTYDSIAYTAVQVSTFGYVQFGLSAYSLYYNPYLFMPYAPMTLVAPWWDDLTKDATASVQWLTSGVAPNRVFTIQYSAYPDYYYSPNARLNFQVKLFETSNKIQFLYGSISGTSSSSSTASIGIKGRVGSSGDFIDGTTGSKTVGNSNLASGSGFPAANTVLTFAPDTSAPTGLIGVPGNAVVNLKWNRTKLSTFLRYRIYQGTSPSTLVLRDSTLSLTDTVFSASGLTNATTYYFGVSTVGTDLSESGFSQIISATPTVPPTVSFATPLNGALLSSRSYTLLTVNTTDADGYVSQVSYYQGSVLIGSSTSGGVFSYYWYPSADGAYTLTAQAKDNAGAITVSAPITVTVYSPPAVSMSAPLSGSGFSVGSDINLSATASDLGGSVSKVEFYAGTTKLGEDPSTPYTFLWVAPAAGTYSLTAKATDNDGNTTTSSIITVYVSLPPTVNITSPTNGALVSSTGGISLTATASDPDGTISQVSYYRGAVLIGTSYSGPTFPYTWYSPTVGSYTLTAQARDNTGLITTSPPITINVYSPPSVYMSSPYSGSGFATGSIINLVATASDPDGTVSKVEFYSGTTKLGETSTYPYQYAWTAPAVGTYSITAVATDNDGHSTTSSAITIYVSLSPTVSITSPTNGALVSSTSSISLTATASDPDGTISQVSYYRGTVLIGTSTSGPTFPYTWYSPTVGSNTLTAQARDNSGVITTSAPITITVWAPPSVYMSTPYSGSGFATGSIINLVATASDPDGTVSKVEFYSGTTKLGETSTYPYQYPWTAPAVGTYSITAVATDNDGHITTSSAITLYVSTPPTVTITSPANGISMAFPSTITLTATASDPDGTVNAVDFYSNNRYLGRTTGPTTFSLSYITSVPGPQKIVARVFDNYGVEGIPDTIDVHAGPPEVILTSPAYFSAYPSLSTINLSANVSPSASYISEVRFYRDSILIGTDATAPYGYTWASAPKGRFKIQAQATDIFGQVGYSQAVTIFVNDSAKALTGGRVLVTGHDADDHGNVDFISAGLDYLLFGLAAQPFEVPFRKGARIAFLADYNEFTASILDYGMVTMIDPTLAGWDTLAFDGIHFDAIIVGTGLDYVSSLASAAINAKRLKFDEYFNKGGGIFAMSEQGIGQSFYDFLPAFGSAKQQSIGSISGRFTVTPPGLAIGLTEAIVDLDLTHTEFLDVDTVFRTFEIFNDDSEAITIGANAIIEGGGYIPADSVVESPVATARDSVFADTLCVRFSSPTLGATLYLTTNGGNPDTSSWSIANGAMVCIDRSTTFRVIGKKAGWISSADKSFSFRKLDQVIPPLPSVTIPYFRDSLCVHFTSATIGASTYYTLDGGNPDTSSLIRPNGDSVCFYMSDTIRVMSKKTGMLNSDSASYYYWKMEKVATPSVDYPDSTYFSDSLCLTFTDTTPGAHIHYTLDGGDPDTSETHLHDGERLCFDHSLTLRMIGEETNWITSDENTVRIFKMEKLAAAVPDFPDGTLFGDSLCLHFTTNTASATLWYSLDGTDPLASGLTQSMDSALCIDSSVTVRTVVKKVHWIDSDPAAYTYSLRPVVANPVANRADSTYFADTLCVQFLSATDGASIYYVFDGGSPDTSSLVLANNQSLCVDRSVSIRAVAKLTGWANSGILTTHYLKMDTAQIVMASIADSTYFSGSLCIGLTSATVGADIHLVLSAAGLPGPNLVKANGDTICLDGTTTVQAHAEKTNLIKSPERSYTYIRREKVATPTANRTDSSYFADTLCVQFSTTTDSAAIHYVLDGGTPDTSSRVLANNQSLCLDRSVTIRAVAKLAGWTTSDEVMAHYFKMDTAQIVLPSIADSTYFPGSLCLSLTSATVGADIHFTLAKAGLPGPTVIKANGDSICLDDTSTVRAHAEKKNWIKSPERTYTYIRMQKVATPLANKPDSLWFVDSLCVQFSVLTPGAAIHYSLNGGAPDTSALILASGKSLCLDRSTEVRVVAIKPNWINSDEVRYHAFKMDTVAVPVADRADSTYFADSLCVNLSTLTAGAVIQYTLDGGSPDTSRSTLGDHGRFCVDKTVKVRTVAKKANWVTSKEIAWTYIRMQKVGAPTADKSDSSWFVDSLCIKFTLPTPGSVIHYSLDGGRADTSGLILPVGKSLCRDRSGDIQAAALKPNWIPSDEIRLTLVKMDTVSLPVVDQADSTYFRDSLCVNLTTATKGADLYYTTNGQSPDTTSAVLHGSGRVCLEATATLKVVGIKIHSVPSPVVARTLIRMQQVAAPVLNKADSTYYGDTLCIRFTSATDDAKIQYTVDGGLADTSSRYLTNRDSVCLDASANLTAVAVKKNWIASEVSSIQVFHMETVEAPKTDFPDSTYFEDSLCVKWTMPTEGAEIHLTTDGGSPDTAAAFLKDGAKTCMDQSTSFLTLGKKTNWKNSSLVERDYFRMEPIPKPGFDKPDSFFYPTVCVKLSSTVSGADLHYTLDGGNPDTSSQIKHSGDTLCLDRTGDIKMIAKKEHWLDSEPASVHMEKMPKVDVIHSSVADSLVYAHRMCFKLSSSTDSTLIRYSLDGSDPLKSDLTIPSGDSVCLEKSAEVVVIGTREHWRNSETSRFVFIVDNDGPYIRKAVKHPFDIGNLAVSGNCRGLGQDTLVLTLSEKLLSKSKSPRWDRLAVFSARCDSNATMPVPVKGIPTISRDSLTITILLDNTISEEVPRLSNCIYLDSNSGEFTDFVLNRPVKKSAKVEGSEKTVRISQLRAYPPVVGLENTSTSKGCIDESVADNTWIPPFGFDETKGVVDPNAARNCSQGSDNGSDTKRTAIPPCTSILEVISDAGYVADVHIFDQFGNFVMASRQKFGVCGELDNSNRSVAGKKRSFLVWNTRDTQGSRVGTGAYVWQVNFLSDRPDGKKSQMVNVRTGFLRSSACQD